MVDASVVIKWLVPEEYSGEALRLLDDHLEGRVVAAAPSYSVLEVANALRKYVARGLLGEPEAWEAYGILLDAGLELHEVEGEAAGEALRYALENSVTVYDAYYIVLARRLGAVFYTADERLLRRLRGREPSARHIAEYPGG